MEPTRLGPYTITRRLGRGGMGAVYEAEDMATGETVAIKTLAAHLLDDDGLRRRFQAEIETLKTLRHPGIVQLLAFGEEEGEPYFVMELVRGQTLEQLLRAGRRFSWQETLAIAADIARALKAAHDHGVVHRDLKPANLLFGSQISGSQIDPTVDVARVKLADFGIARLFGDTRHTMAGTVVGTAEYMSPEQAVGAAVDPRADLYALGLVMFAMVTGKPPFHGGTADQLLDRHRREPPPRVATLAPDVPPVLDALIDRLLAKDPTQRPASALALGRLLAAVEEVAGTTQPVATQPAVIQPAVIQPAVILAMETLPAGVPAPDVAAAPTQGDRPRQVDLFAATWEMPQQAAAQQPARPRAQQPTVPITTAEHETAEPQSARTRYTTVADLDAAARGQARRRFVWTLLARTAAFVTLVGLVAGGAWALLRQPAPDTLYDAIFASVAANPDRVDGLKDALPDIERFLDWYPEDPRAASVRGLRREVDLDRLAARARLRERKSTPPYLRIERDYRLAVTLKSSDLASAAAAFEAILATPRDALATPLTQGSEADPLIRDPDLWLALVREQLRTLPHR